MRLILFGGFSFGKMGEIWKNVSFFPVATAGLGKYRVGGYGRIGVYSVTKDMGKDSSQTSNGDETRNE